MVRPALSETPALPSPPLLKRLRHFLLDTWRGRILTIALGVWLLDGLLGLVRLGAPASLRGFANFALAIFALWGTWRGLRWLSAHFLWRIRTKLILSYLFVALVPVVLLSLFLGIGAILFMGLVASRLVTGKIDRAGDVLRATARSALADLDEDDARAAAAIPGRLAPAEALHPGMSWTLLRNGRVVGASGDAPRELPSWWQGPGFAGLVPLTPGQNGSRDNVVRAVWAESSSALLIDVPADEHSFAGLEGRTGANVIPPSVLIVTESDGEPPDPEPDDHEVHIVIADGPTTPAGAIDSGLTFVAFPTRTNWETGETSVFSDRPLTFQFRPLDLVRRLSPGLLPRETGATTLPDLLLFAMGVLVADVSGKGTSAALYMAELKGLVLSLSRIHDSPARLLVKANHILADAMDSRTFVTMTYAVVDRASRSMRFARAGHNPLIHLEAASGTTHVYTPPGLGLGLDGGEAFEEILEEKEVPLAPGDFFLFFTDGLSEAMNEGAELFGEPRLRRILEESEGLSSEQLRARILGEVESFVGEAAPHDDLTMVVLKVVEEESPS